MKNVHLIAAARPNFMKIAPLYHELKSESWCIPKIVHTGQHYDANMSDSFFRDLGMPSPHFHLGVGSGSHGEQTGRVIIEYERVARSDDPDWIVVVGDVNSTVACALVGTKLQKPVVHLEAGLRSRDRKMPEEINRLATDAISDLLWTPSRDADQNLIAEGIPPERIECIGNIMIDSFEMLRDRIEADETRTALGLGGADYGVVTLHRPSNVDDPAQLGRLVKAIIACSRYLPLIFPVHPRTRKALSEHGLMAALSGTGSIRLLEPLGYIQFMNLVTGSRVVITDSGGVQEETTYLGIPCLTLRENTERPITILQGTNRLVDADTLDGAIVVALQATRDGANKPELWDGRAASRAAASLRCRAGRESSGR